MGWRGWILCSFKREPEPERERERESEWVSLFPDGTLRTESIVEKTRWIWEKLRQKWNRSYIHWDNFHKITICMYVCVCVCVCESVYTHIHTTYTQALARNTVLVSGFLFLPETEAICIMVCEQVKFNPMIQCSYNSNNTMALWFLNNQTFGVTIMCLHYY